MAKLRLCLTIQRWQTCFSTVPENLLDLAIFGFNTDAPDDTAV